MRLKPYAFIIKYLPGKQNAVNPLSRLLRVDEHAEHSLSHKVPDEFVRFVAVRTTSQAMTIREIEVTSSEDREFVELRQCIENRNWKGDQQKKYILVGSELCVIGKFILCCNRIVIPSKLRPRLLAHAHEAHLGVVSMKQ